MASGLTQGFFESDEEYEKKALLEAVKRISGVSQGLFQSDEDYIKDAMPEALKNASGEYQGFFETANDFCDRARSSALDKWSGTSQGFFEGEESYKDRAMDSLSSSMGGRYSSFTYLANENAKQIDDKGSESYSGYSNNSYNDINNNTTGFSEKYPILSSTLAGIGIGLAIVFVLTVITLDGIFFSESGQKVYNVISTIAFYGSIVVGFIRGVKKKFWQTIL